MVVDGVELLRLIRDGEIKSGTKITVHTPNYDSDYWFWGNWFGEKDGYSRKMDNMELHLCDKDCTFEILSEEIDIQELQEVNLFSNGVNSSEDTRKKCYDINFIIIEETLNEIIKAIKQSDKKIK